MNAIAEKQTYTVEEVTGGIMGGFVVRDPNGKTVAQYGGGKDGGRAAAKSQASDLNKAYRLGLGNAARLRSVLESVLGYWDQADEGAPGIREMGDGWVRSARAAIQKATT